MTTARAILAFRVEGPLVPYVRMTQRSKYLGPAQRYLSYRSEVSARAREALAGEGPMEGRIAIHIHIAAKKRRYDLDNAIKCVLDGLNKIAFRDDKQIVDINAAVHDGEFNYLYVAVEQVSQS